MRDQSGFECGEGFIQPAAGADTCEICAFGLYRTDTQTCAAVTQGNRWQGSSYQAPSQCFAGTYSDAATLAD